MRKFFFRLAILIGIAISISACDDLGSDYKTLWVSAIDSSTTTLTADTWADGNLSSGGEQWFKFTATADEQYIHINFDTTEYPDVQINVQVYDSNGNGIEINPINNSYLLTVISGQVYYIKVQSYNNYSGTYQIAFNNSANPPS